MKQQQSAGKSKKRKPRNSRSRGSSVQGNRIKNSGFSGAPAAVSDFLRQTVSFRPSTGGKGLIMDVCAALFNIGSAGVSGDTAAIGFPGESTADLAYNATFNPTSSATVVNVAGTPTHATNSWINPVWELISSAFVRYKIRKMILEYMPQSASTVGDQLVCSFANDPLHPVIGFAPTGGFPLTNQQLLGLSDSVPFMPWREWSLDVTRAFDMDQPFFVSRDANFSGEQSALRLSEGGVIAVTNSGTATAPITYGVMYLRSEIEFLEFCPILPYTLTTALSRTRNKTGVPPKEDITGFRKEAGVRPPQAAPCDHDCCEQHDVCDDCKPVAPQCDVTSKHLCCDEEGEPGFQVIRISKDPTYTERQERTGNRGIDSIAGNLGRKPSLLTVTRRD